MEEQIFKGGQGAIESVVLWNNANVPPCEGRSGDNIAVGNGDAAGGRQRSRGADTDRRGLAGAIWTEQAENVAFGNRDVNAVYGRDPFLRLIYLCQCLNRDNRIPYRMGDGGTLSRECATSLASLHSNKLRRGDEPDQAIALLRR